MLPTILSPDKFGYFQVGNFKTYSKLEAIDIQHVTGQWPKWYFNDEIFNQYNWFLEPLTDIDTLYQMRARQIREAYDYCVLFFSGGADSTNILSSWYAAGCQMDEIVVMHTNDVREEHINKNYDWGSEIQQVTQPIINQLRKQGHTFKYREIYTPDLILEYIKQVKENYFYYSNHCLSPNSPFKSILREKIDDYRKIIDSGKRLCFIHGIEKPHITVDKNSGQWFFSFTDQLDTCVSPYVQERYNQGWYDELFYWTPDLPELPIKQAHITKRFCETVNDKSFYQVKPTGHGYNFTLKMYLTLNATRKLLYPTTWNPKIYQASKSRHSAIRPGYGNLAFSERDGWFFRSQNRLVRNYATGMEGYLQKLKNNNFYDWTDTSPNALTVIKQSMKTFQFA